MNIIRVFPQKGGLLMLTERERELIETDPRYVELKGQNEEYQEYAIRYCAKYLLCEMFPKAMFPKTTREI